MKVTMGQVLEEWNDPGLGRRLFYNMNLKPTTALLGKKCPEMVFPRGIESHCMTQTWKVLARPRRWKALKGYWIDG